MINSFLPDTSSKYGPRKAPVLFNREDLFRSERTEAAGGLGCSGGSILLREEFGQEPEGKPAAGGTKSCPAAG